MGHAILSRISMPINAVHAVDRLGGATNALVFDTNHLATVGGSR